MVKTKYNMVLTFDAMVAIVARDHRIGCAPLRAKRVVTGNGKDVSKTRKPRAKCTLNAILYASVNCKLEKRTCTVSCTDCDFHYITLKLFYITL
jgi:hypothetical protein